MSFFDNLQQASLGGVPFGVLSGESRFGRRQAVHEYPFRDTPWVEDMGRSARRINVTGFLIENDAIYGGGDVIAQRDRMIAVAESPGASTLIHPTLGRLNVSLLGISITEKWDAGRYFELGFSFIESGQRVFPEIGSAPSDSGFTQADIAAAAAAEDFVQATIAAYRFGAPITQIGIATANSWGQNALNAANDATGALRMVATFQPTLGTFGRFFGGGNSGFMASVQMAEGAAQTVASLIGAGISARANVIRVANSLKAAIAGGIPAAIAAAAQALSNAVLKSMADPADGIRLLYGLAVFSPNSFTTPSVIGRAQATMQTSMGNLFRRSAVISLAKAGFTYQPSSSDDAANVRNLITDRLDSEIEIAGDNGEDATFGALRALRGAVVNDLNTRGAALPSIKEFTFRASLPAPVLAQMLYRDPGRADEIERQTHAPHPAFQPLSVRVLGS